MKTMKMFSYLLKMEPGEHSKPEEELFSGDLVDLLFFKYFAGVSGAAIGDKSGYTGRSSSHTAAVSTSCWQKLSALACSFFIFLCVTSSSDETGLPGALVANLLFLNC